MGGVDKGNDYTQIDELVAKQSKSACMYGKQIIINCLIILAKKVSFDF